MNFSIQRVVGVSFIVMALAVMFVGFTPTAKAETNTSQFEQIQTLLAMIEQLQAQLAQLQGGGSSGTQCIQLSRSLFLGSSDRDTAGEVSKLQRFLTSTGHYTYAEITGYFGPATQRAVQAWQASKGVISSGSPKTTGYGVVGPSTRSAIARGCVSNPVFVPEEVEEEEEELEVSVTSISNSENPTVKGEAYGTNVVGFSVGNGDKVYGSGAIQVVNNQWTHKISTDLEDGSYTLTVYVDNNKVASKSFEVDEEESDSHSVKLYGEDKISGHSDTYEISPTIWQDVTLDVTNHTLIQECRMVASYDNGTEERDEQFIPRSYSNEYRVPTAMTLWGNFSFVTSLEVDCEYYGNTHIREEIKFATEDSDEEKAYRISFDGVDVKSGTERKHKAFSECENEYENSRDLQSAVVVRCYWDNSLFFDGGGKG